MTTARALRIADVLVVAVLAVTAQVQVWSAAAYPQGGTVVHAALAALATLPLLVRNRYPVAVIAIVTLSASLQFQLGAGLGQGWFALLLATYALGAHAELPLSAVGLVPVGAGILAIDLPRLMAGAPIDEVVPVWATIALIWMAGRWVRGRRQESADLRLAAARLELEREARATAAVADERARIARELHDLVAHSMSVINLQAQGARRVLEIDPVAAAQALASIEAASREGLDEMRRLLAVLRTTEDRAGLRPQPGLTQLAPLVAQVRDAGLDVTLEVDGEPRPLPSGVELAAYRVVQEALTNALKHGRPGRAQVRLRYRAAEVEIEIDNQTDVGAASPGHAAGPDREGPGHGLIGMRERVSLYGGVFEAGRQPGGAFVVRVRLPAPGPNT